MAKVQVNNVVVLDNPSPFYNPFQFEITFECIEDLSEGERVAPGCQLRRRTLKFSRPGLARGGPRPAGGQPCEGNLKLRDAGRAATCEQLAGRREPCCQLCLWRAALGGPRLARRWRGVVRPRRPQGPAARREHARPVESGAILPGGTTPAPDRRGRAGPRLPARVPPRLSSRRSPAPSTNQRGRRALGSAPRCLAPRGRPCSPAGARDAVRRLSRGTEIPSGRIGEGLGSSMAP